MTTTHVRAHHRGHAYHHALKHDNIGFKPLFKDSVVHPETGEATFVTLRKKGKTYIVETTTEPGHKVATKTFQLRTETSFPGDPAKDSQDYAEGQIQHARIAYYAERKAKATGKFIAKEGKAAGSFALKEGKVAAHATGEFAKKEWGTFKNFLTRKKEERARAKALKEETGQKLETY
jgi:hypothetical protein